MSKIRISNLIDLSKVTLENYNTFNERIIYEIPRQWGLKNTVTRKKPKTLEEKEQYKKAYQHEYYLRVTKPKEKVKGE